VEYVQYAEKNGMIIIDVEMQRIQSLREEVLNSKWINVNKDKSSYKEINK
jgi:hypothetical protein